jgi:hypothetical protein
MRGLLAAGVVVGLGCAPLHAQNIVPGGAAYSVTPDKTIWGSKCPPQARPFSGTCGGAEPGTGTFLLDFGEFEEQNAWICVWNKPVAQGNMQAWCLKQ